MSVIFLALSTVGILLLGYVLMAKLDRFWDETQVQDAPREEAMDALVLVDEQCTREVETALAQYWRWIWCVHDPQPPGNMAFRAMLAASGDDLSNILLCAQVRKTRSVYAVALCNNPNYLLVYRDCGIECVTRSLDEALELFGLCLKERLDFDD